MAVSFDLIPSRVPFELPLSNKPQADRDHTRYVVAAVVAVLFATGWFLFTSTFSLTTKALLLIPLAFGVGTCCCCGLIAYAISRIINQIRDPEQNGDA